MADEPAAKRRKTEGEEEGQKSREFWSRDHGTILEHRLAAATAANRLKLASWEPLKALGRTVCPKCHKNRKYFCYDCFLVMGKDDYVPKLKLPIFVDIAHFPSEMTSKRWMLTIRLVGPRSSAVHAKILAPDFVRLVDYPDIPEFPKDETVILFPADDAIPIEQLDFSKVSRVVFVDCQWHKTTRMLTHENLLGIKRVRIDSQKTYFWRYQDEGEHCLATIEAIYYFIKEFTLKKTGKYDGEYDNLLYYYAFFYSIIQQRYKQSKTEFPRKQNYVQLDETQAKASQEPKGKE